MATDSSGRLRRYLLQAALNAARPGETIHVQLHTRTDAELRASAGDTFPVMRPGDTIRVTARGSFPADDLPFGVATDLPFDVVMDPDMPPDQFAVRSGPLTVPLREGNPNVAAAFGARYRHPAVIARMEAAARSGMSVFGQPDPDEVAAAERCPLPLRELDDTHRLLLAGGPGADYWAWRHVATRVWIGRPGRGAQRAGPGG